MVRVPVRLVQRFLVLALGVFGVWLGVFVAFDVANRRLHWVLALAAAYGVAAYVVFPRVVRWSWKILRREHVPRYTITGDGLPGDPVNLALAGTLSQLQAAFASAGWSPADPLGLASSWGMCKAFLFNKPYPTAPFSTLYLFGRGQDVGFQKAIDDSPRKRHHIRFWSLDIEHAKAAVGSASIWQRAERPRDDARVLWVGAGTKDTGLGLTRLTFKITHATDADTNAERDFIVDELGRSGVIAETRRYRAGERLETGKVNHYVTDGEVTLATLVGSRTETGA
jgi:LssY-like putative type I secretion system component LssY